MLSMPKKLNVLTITEEGLEELSFRQFKIIINEGKYVNTALLLLKHPSDAIKEKLKTKGMDELKSFETIQKLKSDKIVFAINPRTNYLIVEFQKYIKHMDADDKSVLNAIFDGQNDWMKITKYLNKRNIEISKPIDDILEKLKKLHLIEYLNQISETGSAIATILKLIPDL